MDSLHFITGRQKKWCRSFAQQPYQCLHCPGLEQNMTWLYWSSVTIWHLCYSQSKCLISDGLRGAWKVFIYLWLHSARLLAIDACVGWKVAIAFNSWTNWRHRLTSNGQHWSICKGGFCSYSCYDSTISSLGSSRSQLSPGSSTK